MAPQASEYKKYQNLLRSNGLIYHQKPIFQKAVKCLDPEIYYPVMAARKFSPDSMGLYNFLTR